MSAFMIRRVSKFMLLLLLLACLLPLKQAAAQGSTPIDLINAINALRASRGLAPYTIDSSLMAMAQEHSEYQASIRTSTHQHRDGRVPRQLGVVENVAGGTLGYLDPDTVITEIWADAGHMRTMVGFAAGSIGAGIANDGTTEYYTIEVRPSGAAAATTGQAGAAQQTATPYTPIPLVPLVTCTPHENGAIVHVVGYGQTLWAIAQAYNIRVDQIRAWNNIAADSNDIYAGQKLLVRPAGFVSTPSVPQPAATPTATAVVVTTAVPSVSPTAEATEPPRALPTVMNTLTPTPAAAALPFSTQAIPFWAVAILIAGCVLLIVLFVTRKK